MDRRDFVTSTLAGAAPALAHRRGRRAVELRRRRKPTRKFRLDYAPHFGMFTAARRRRSRRAARVHGGRRVHGARGQRHAGPARRRCRSDRQGAGAARHADGRLRRAHDQLERADAHAPAMPAQRDAFLKEVRESVDVAKRVEREVDDGRARPRRPPARHRTTRPPTSIETLQARVRRSSSRTAS